MSDLQSDVDRNIYMLCDASGSLTPFTEFSTRAFLPFYNPRSWAPTIIPKVNKRQLWISGTRCTELQKQLSKLFHEC